MPTETNYHMQGYSARNNGAQPWHCPHPDNSKAASEWHRGWEDCDWLNFSDDEDEDE